MPQSVLQKRVFEAELFKTAASSHAQPKEEND